MHNRKTFHHVLAELRGQAILVANRGIVARRICRSLRERFEVRAMMTSSLVDRASPAATSADELLLLENRSYLDIDYIVSEACKRGIVGIHPGWGFASEDQRFPQLCAQQGITFIGPSATAMQALGSKLKARQLAKQLDIPTIPGADQALTLEQAREMVHQIGLPVLLKAEGGGGGRGIYIIQDQSQLELAFEKARQQAESSFGNPNIYLERFLPRVRHLEIQVIADQHGNIFTFDERDCSLQRNHQKLVEITPSPWPKMNEQLRQRLKDYSAALIRSCGYYSLATVEFLIDEDGQPYFIEVNTRLQVEHGITEARYGVDLVEEQIAIAFGAELRFSPQVIRPQHWAMQVRINCEDPGNNFTPSTGTIDRYISPGGPGVRLDSNLASGYEFPSQYDSAGALLIVHAHRWNKLQAILKRCLHEYHISGVKTTIPFFKKLLQNENFKNGAITTRFLEQHPELLSYVDYEPSAYRMAKLVAEISVRGYNPYLQLGQYRSKDGPRVGHSNPVLPIFTSNEPPPAYPLRDRQALLERVRDDHVVHFSDTTCRDLTQSDTANRFRLTDDRLIGPYLDRIGYFSLETGGGAHFHVAMLANMTSPWEEAREWNHFAPRTPKQILVRSTNLLGYKPQPRSVMQRTCERICEEFHIIRCFDFLNYSQNMFPLAEVVLSRNDVVFEPALSLSYTPCYPLAYYVQACEQLLDCCSKASGRSVEQVSSQIILGLKDMAGVCPPTFISALVGALRARWPQLLLHYHRHITDGLFIPAVVAAIAAGVQIVDVGLGAAVRCYGQGDVSATAAALNEVGHANQLDHAAIEQANFVLKQLMPVYDQYTSPYFRGVDYGVLQHAMPGGAVSSSQQAAVAQGHIRLLPHILHFIKRSRQIVHYHDVTPGSQITWNTAFLAVTGAWKRGHLAQVEHLLKLMDTLAETAEEQLDESIKQQRLLVYSDANDAFRDLLLGAFGPLPLGFPPDWVYQSAFGNNYRQMLLQRREVSPLSNLAEVDFERERQIMASQMNRPVKDDELLLYLSHPSDALRMLKQRERFGAANNLPTAVWFEGLAIGEEVEFIDDEGRNHRLKLLHISPTQETGCFWVRYQLDYEIVDTSIALETGAQSKGQDGMQLADPNNEYHIGAPCNGDLWIVRVKPGDLVKRDQELCNISVMKQEKSILSPIDALVSKVHKTANYQKERRMVAVKAGELLIELTPLSAICRNVECARPLQPEYLYCPHCATLQKILG